MRPDFPAFAAPAPQKKSRILRSGSGENSSKSFVSHSASGGLLGHHRTHTRHLGGAHGSVLDGLPLHLAHQGNHSDGHIGEQEQREGKGVEDLLLGGGGNLLPLGDGGRCTKGEEADVEHHYGRDHGAAGLVEDAAGNVGRLGEAGHQQDQVQSQHHQGEQHTRRHSHQHIVAGEFAGLMGKAALKQRKTVLEVHLVEALGPTQTLIPGLLEGDRLLVVEDCGFAVADALALEGAVGRELDVLGEQVVGPAAVLMHDLGRNQKTGAGDGTVGADEHPGEVQESGLAHEPQAVAGTDPVVGEVLGVAVAGQRLIVAGIEHFVHLIDKVGVDDVVGIKNEEAIVAALADVGLQLMEQVAQSIALALVDGIEPFIDGSTGPTGCPGGIVGAVIGHYIDIQQLPGVVLGGQAADQLTDDLLLVAGRDHHRIPVLLLGHKDPGLVQAEQAIHQVDQLIEIGCADGERQHKVKIRNQFQHSTLSNFYSSGQLSRFFQTCIPSLRGIILIIVTRSPNVKPGFSHEYPVKSRLNLGKAPDSRNFIRHCIRFSFKNSVCFCV